MKTFLMTVTICSLFLSYESKEFCQAFADNGFRLDYTLDLAMNNRTWILFIAKDYWFIHRIDDTIEFRSIDSTDRQWFGINYEYRTGFEIINNQSIQTSDKKNSYESIPVVSLLRKSKMSVDLGQITDPTNFTDLSQIMKFTLDNPLTLKPLNSTFEPSFSVFNGRYTVMIGEQTPDSRDPKRFYRNYKQIDGTNFEQQSSHRSNKTQLHRIGGVFYSHKVENGSNYTVLYSMDTSLHYCFSEDPVFNKECKTGIKQLIDCQKAEKTFIWFYVAIGGVIVLLVVIIIGIAFVIKIIRKRRRKASKTETVSSNESLVKGKGSVSRDLEKIGSHIEIKQFKSDMTFKP